MPLTTKPKRGAPVLVDQATGNGSFSIMATNDMAFDALTLDNDWAETNTANRGDTGAIRWGPFVNFRMALDSASATSHIVGVLDALYIPPFNVSFPVAFAEIKMDEEITPYLTIRGNAYTTPGQVEVVSYDKANSLDFFASVMYWVGL